MGYENFNIIMMNVIMNFIVRLREKGILLLKCGIITLNSGVIKGELEK